MQALNPLKVPLSGLRLIEASAGTGKTYTITNLYLRFLLETDHDIKEILVVTFTQAATEELRGRIRDRLREAADAFDAGQSDDEILAGLLQSQPDPMTSAQQLRDALTRMDEAAIFTIHSFCQRMLQENAFESGAFFDAEFISDEQELQATIIEDFWRQQFYQAPLEWVEWVRKYWSSPEGLLRDIGSYLKNGSLKIIPDIGPRDVEEADREYAKLGENICALWQDEQATITAILTDDKGLSRAENTYRPDRLEAAIAALQTFVASKPTSRLLPAGFELFTADKLAASLKKNAVAPRHRFFDLCQAVKDCNERLLKLAAIQVRRSAIDFLRQELIGRKRDRRILSYDDLLTNLHRALHSDGGHALAKHITTQYPVAMIDEFQDTDPLQYQIFNFLYRDRPGYGLFMIGDPKQAIYSFRGADIFAYMQARRDTEAATDHYTLDTNWRSSERLVQAVNTLFGRAQAPFVFADDIDFYPLSSAGKADQAPFLIDGRAPVPLQAWFVEANESNLPSRGPRVISKDWAKVHVSRACAAEIVRLLRLGQQQRATLGGVPLAPRDIALLVRDRYEAEAMQQALRASNVASVYFSRDSVFATTEAEELDRVLTAVAEPLNEALLRAALCTEMLGLSADALDALVSDDQAWERWLQQPQDYHDLWQSRGFMAMFRTLLHEQDIAHRLLSGVEGERRMTNLLHLGELLQSASREQHGIEGLLRWFAGQREAANGEHEDQQLRLESDEDLVKIVTIHKSKGLEYPLVFLPFIWGSRLVEANRPFLFHGEKDRRLHLDLGSEADNYRLAERERLAEDLRLLYVALTRAKYRCYFTWGAFKGASTSALAYLLHPSKDRADEPALRPTSTLSHEEIQGALDALAREQSEAICVDPLPEPSVDVFDIPTAQGGRGVARIFTGHIDRRWRVTSYSTLASTRSDPLELPDYDALVETGASRGEMAKPARPDIFQFPRGAQAGTFMHTLLEHLDFPQAKGEHLSREVEHQLDRHGYDRVWQPVVERMVSNVLDTPLGTGGSLCLRDIAWEKRLIELEFYYPLKKLKAADLEVLMARRGDARSDRAPLDFKTVQGMMKGYIDLVFEHEGRFYIVDYKSNHLGDAVIDYDQAQLKAAMLEHRYDLQYLIYAVALHRYLKHRLKEYAYGQHFGGVYYLFLRGMDAQQGSDYGVYYAKPESDLIRELDALFAGNPKAAA